METFIKPKRGGEGRDRMGFRYEKKVCVASSGVRLFRERVVEGSGGQVFEIDNSEEGGEGGSKGSGRNRH